MAIPGDLGARRLITHPWPYDSATLTFYVRPGGNDDNGGQSALDAFLTFGRAVIEVALYAVLRPTRINITGMEIDEAEVLQLGGTMLGGISFNYDLTEPPPNYFGWRYQTQIVADPTEVLELDVTAQTPNATSGLLTLTVNNALAANQLDDMFAVSTGFGEYGAIRSHTAGAGPNQVVISSITPFTTLPVVTVYEPGATMRYGDAANFFEQAIYLNALSDFYLAWINFESNGPKSCALTVWSQAPVSMFGCRFEGLQLLGGAGVVTIDNCVIRNEVLALDGATFRILATNIHDISSVLCHGSGASGLNEVTATRIYDNAGAWGSGNIESRFTFSLANCEVDGSAGDGVDCRFGHSSLVECEIHDNATAGVRISNVGASCLMTSVGGAANGTTGVNVVHGNVSDGGGNTVTGAGGDVAVGGAGTFLWAGLPQTDGNELARAG